MLEINVLGRFEVLRGGQPVEIPSRPAQSLLAFLALNAGVAHRREKLAGLLWPESSESNARANLRAALWRIRKSLESTGAASGRYLSADDIALTLDPAECRIDAVELERAGPTPGIGELIESAAMYRGELLPGFFDDWVVLERERLRAAYEHCVGLLLERLLAGGRWGEVLEWGERWIGLGGAPEPAYRGLMQAYAGLADLSGVAAAYQRCAEALMRELGVEPSPETRALFEAIRSGQAGALAAERAAWPTTPGREGPGAAPPGTAVRADETPAPGEPPYMGLQSFDEADAALYYGREQLVSSLAERLREQPFIALVGASGSGKSSLVRAGLIPALRRNGSAGAAGGVWIVHVITPTVRPLQALAVSLTRDSESVTAAATLQDDLARDRRALGLYVQRLLSPEVVPLASLRRPSAPRRMALVVDQFEEVFTLCDSEPERRAFIENLTTCSESPGTSVILTLRADFYAHCAPYADLREALARHQEYLGPMSAAEMRQAIETPARHGGWELEGGLADLFLHDVGGEPGALPLLSHALLETWKRRRGRSLTLKGYAEAGGVHGAIGRTADSVYAGLAPADQAVARGVFVRLTELGEGTQDTCRRASLAELLGTAQPKASVERVLNTLASARLITLSADTAEVAHEALIREWPALRQWLAQDREALRLHRRLTEAALAWEGLEREPGELYRGLRLLQAVEWAQAHPAELNHLESEFLAASRAQAEMEAADREAQRQRELENARRLAEAEGQRAEAQRRAAAQLRRWALYLAVALILALGMAGAALYFGAQANRERRTATARELAAAALSNLGADPERSLLLALQAASATYAEDKTLLPEAATALHQALQASRIHRTFAGHTGPVVQVAFSPDGTRLATAGQDSTARIWDVASGQALLTLTGQAVGVSAVAFSPDGKYLATAAGDGIARLWDAESGELLLSLSGHAGALTDIAFSPDGTRLAAASQNRTVKVWDRAGGTESLTLGGFAQTVMSIAFSPDGTRLAAASRDGETKEWDAATGQELWTQYGATPGDWRLAFSPDGGRLAMIGSDATPSIRDAASGAELLALPGAVEWAQIASGWVNSLAFSPDSTLLATASNDGTAGVWDAGSGHLLFRLAGHTGSVTDVAFSPDGQFLATASADGTARLWSLSPGRELLTLAAHTGAVNDLAFSRDGRYLATAGGDAAVNLFDLEGDGGAKLLTLTDRTGVVNRLAFGPECAGADEPAGGDCRPLLATADSSGLTQVWQLSPAYDEAREVQRFERGSGALAVVFSSDGSRLATASADGTAKIWDLSPGAADRPLLELTGHAGAVTGVAYFADGTRLVTSSIDATAKVWDAQSGRVLANFTGHTRPVHGLALSPDGTLVATASDDGTARLFNVATGEIAQVLSGHQSAVQDVAFSLDGLRLAMASADGTVIVWDASTGRQLATLTGIAGPAFRVAFSPAGERIAAAGADGTVRLYTLDAEELLRLARSRVTRSLTVEECRQYLHVDKCPPSE